MKRKFEILVVDDDLKNIQVGINFLKQNEDYHLVFATSGQQALERVKEMEFDLVLLDIIMPVMDGYEVCRQLKSNPKTRNIPVIFLTAKHEADSLMKGFELGGADYITKPFNAPELNARVKTHLELHSYYKEEIAKLQELLSCCEKAETIKFVAEGVIHDCNNFLASIPPSIHMVCSRMQKNGVATAPFTDLLDGVNNAAKNVTDLLSTLTQFSLQTEQSRNMVDMNEVISDLKKVFKSTLQHKITLEIHLLSQPALVMANKLHVVQVLLNLLINAQHAILAREDIDGNTGRICLTIDKTPDLSTEPGRTSSYLRIAIEDNGIGMTREIQEKIFDKYFTTRKEEGGTGLGLAVSRNIIQSHGGSIRVSSEAGQGSTFEINLPYYSDATVDSDQMQPEQWPGSPAP